MSISRIGLMKHVNMKNIRMSRFFSTKEQACALATLKKTNQVWNRSITLLPHLIEGGLTVGSVGFGSPHFAAARHRESSLLTSLKNGCNLIELGEAWKREDPRIFNNEAYLDQFLYGSWESAELDKIYTKTTMGEGSLSSMLDSSNVVNTSEEEFKLKLTREEVVYMGKCSLGLNEKDIGLDQSNLKETNEDGTVNGISASVKQAVSQLCEYHFVDSFDFIILNISHLDVTEDPIEYENKLLQVLRTLEDICDEGTMTAYGFSLDNDHITFQLNALKNVFLTHSDGKTDIPFSRFSFLGLPAGPFTHLPNIETLKKHVGFEHVHIIGESVTHEFNLNGATCPPVRYVNALPSNVFHHDVDKVYDREDGERLSKALNRAIHLEKEYVNRFIEGKNNTQIYKDDDDEETEGSSEEDEEEEVEYPLPFLPRHEDVSWGTILAQHHDKQIEGPDEWESAKERMMKPLLEQALMILSEHKQTKDWAILYKVTCRELFKAFDEEHNYRRRDKSLEISEYIDSYIPQFKDKKAFGPLAPTLEARCACLAMSKGCDIVLTEDWLEGHLYNRMIPGNIILSKDATKLANSPFKK